MGQAQLEHPAPTAAGVSVIIRPLPRRPVPLRDELLSSWIARLADANHCSAPELCGYLGLAGERPPETLEELAGVDIERLCSITCLARSDLNRMLLKRRAGFPVECIFWTNFQNCPTCTRESPEVSSRHWRYAWSLVCEICGSELFPLRPDPKGADQLPARLRTRAVEGAGRMKKAYRDGNGHAGRRMDLTMQVVGVLEHGLRHGSIFSQNQHDRYSMLAALNVGMTRPLLAVAVALRNDPAAETSLRMAFSHRRKLLDRLASLADDLPSLRTGNGETGADWSRNQRRPTTATPQPEYLAAANQAINQLGATADRGELLRRAESILQSDRQQPVDIQ